MDDNSNWQVADVPEAAGSSARSWNSNGGSSIGFATAGGVPQHRCAPCSVERSNSNLPLNIIKCIYFRRILLFHIPLGVAILEVLGYPLRWGWWHYGLRHQYNHHGVHGFLVPQVQWLERKLYNAPDQILHVSCLAGAILINLYHNLSI